MRRPGHEHGNLEFACEHQQARNMVGVLMRNHNRGERMRVVSGCLHTLESFAAGNASVDKNAGRRTLHNRAVSPAAAGQHRDRNAHARSILPRTVETEVTFWLADTFGWGSYQLLALSIWHLALSPWGFCWRQEGFRPSAKCS